MKTKERSELPHFQSTPPSDASFCQWLFRHCNSYIKGRTLVAGNYITQLCRLFTEQGFPIHACETNVGQTVSLIKEHEINPLLRAIHNIRLDLPLVDEKANGAFKSIIFIPDSSRELNTFQLQANMLTLLGRGGLFIVTIPSSTAAFNEFSLSAEEWKNVNHANLSKTFSRFKLLKLRSYLLSNEEHGNYTSSHIHVLAILQKTG